MIRSGIGKDQPAFQYYTQIEEFGIWTRNFIVVWKGTWSWLVLSIFKFYFTILLATLLYYDIYNVWPKYNSNSAVGWAGWLAILWFVNLTIACFCIHWLCIGSKTSFTSYKFIMCKFYEHNHFHLVVTNYFVSISIQKHVNNNTALALFT